MNYYIQGDAAKSEDIRAVFESKGIRVPHFRSCGDSSLIYFSLNKEVLAVTIKALELFEDNPDYTELELLTKAKFKVGDWVVIDNRHNSVYQVESVREYDYMLKHTHGGLMPFPFSSETRLSLWTIEDAKDGDVITNGKLIVIFNKLEEPAYKQHIIAYVGLDLCGRLQIVEDTWQLGVDKSMPATKEQRDRLFAKLKEADYTWDEKNKELKKKHYDILNFKPFDKVLVRDTENEKWVASLFSNFENVAFPHKFVCIDTCYTQCIPFEGNEHLLGTTDMCPEEYINW